MDGVLAAANGTATKGCHNEDSRLGKNLYFPMVASGNFDPPRLHQQGGKVTRVRRAPHRKGAAAATDAPSDIEFFDAEDTIVGEVLKRCTRRIYGKVKV